MKFLNKILIITLFFYFNQLKSYAQNDTVTIKIEQLFKIKKNDGNEYIGYIISDDGREVLIQTEELGKIYVPKSDIKSMKPIEQKDKIASGDYRDDGPFTTRYHFTTNSLPIKKGEDYAMVQLYGPEVHFAIADRFSVGLMTTWIGSPLVLALKYTIPTNNEKINFGLGSLLGSSGYFNGFKSFGGLHWGMITFGDRKKNLTISAGYAHFDLNSDLNSYNKPGKYDAKSYYEGDPIQFPYDIPNEYVESNLAAPVISIGGIANVGKRASFVFDAMLFFSNQINGNIESSYKYHYSDGSVYDSQQYFYDPNQGEIPQPEYVEVSVEKSDKKRVLFYMMPGMRFQQGPDQAFQIAVAGVSIFGKLYNGPPSFPVPTASWFFKF